MKTKAGELKYHIVNAEQAHAEGEFVQFLLKRNDKQGAETYTHIIGMGCSKQHCKECNCLLRLFLGDNYYEFTAVVKRENEQSKVSVQEQQGLSNNNKLVVTREQQTNYEPAYGVDAISNKYYNQFSLKGLLLSAIKRKTDINIPDIKRYNNIPSNYMRSADD